MPTAFAPTLAATWLDRLMGLSRLSLFDENGRLSWRHELPVVVWVLIALAAVAFSAWSYGQLIGSRPARIALAALRALIIIVVAALIAGPIWVVERTQSEPDVVLVLVDRSASMKIRDVVTATDARPISRDDSLRRALDRDAAALTPAKWGDDHIVQWLAFDSSTREIEGAGGNAAPDKSSDKAQPAPGPAPLPDPLGQATAIRTAIEQGLQRAAGRNISGIVLITDGRSPQETGGDLVGRLKQQRIGVYPVPLGSRQSRLNFFVSRVEVPERAFINDTVPVGVTISAEPRDAAFDPSRLTLKLVDKQTGKQLDEIKGDKIPLDQPAKLSTETAAAGKQTWRVELTYDPPADAPVAQQELISDDNSREFAIELIDQPIRVLYVEGYPRWEYRFLKTVLQYDASVGRIGGRGAKSVNSSIMLISADRAFAQEGDTPITALPSTLEQMRPYDVIIIGDVPANYFSAEQLTLIKDQVSVRGAGLIWIGGEYATPRSYVSTPLQDFLPMVSPAKVDRLDPALGAIAMRPTAAAESLNVLRLRDGAGRGGAGAAGGAAKDAGWPADLPPFLWAQQLGALKPTAEVLAESSPIDGKAQPLVTRLRVGAGISVYLATDEIWRWRYGRGEHFCQQFWIQMIRMLGQQRLQRRDDRLTLAVSSRQVRVDQTVEVTLFVNDPLVQQRQLPKMSVAVTRLDAKPGTPAAAAQPVERIDLIPVPPAEGETAGVTFTQYRALWQPRIDGELLLRVVEGGLDDLNITETIEVTHPDDERRQAATDHPRLETLARETGGKVVSLDDLSQLPALLPRRGTQTPNDDREAMWESPLSLMLIVLLITVEWVGRKLLRLV